MYPPDTYPKDTYPPVTYPLDTYPLDTYPLGHIPPGHIPPRLKMPYLVHVWCVDYILHFRTHFFCRDSIYLCHRCNKAVRHLLCQEGLNPHNYSGFQIVRLGEV